MKLLVDTGLDANLCASGAVFGAATCVFLKWLGHWRCGALRGSLAEPGMPLVRCAACIAAEAEAKRLDDVVAKMEVIQNNAGVLWDDHIVSDTEINDPGIVDFIKDIRDGISSTACISAEAAAKLEVIQARAKERIAWVTESGLPGDCFDVVESLAKGEMPEGKNETT